MNLITANSKCYVFIYPYELLLIKCLTSSLPYYLSIIRPHNLNRLLCLSLRQQVVPHTQAQGGGRGYEKNKLNTIYTNWGFRLSTKTPKIYVININSFFYLDLCPELGRWKPNAMATRW